MGVSMYCVSGMSGCAIPGCWVRIQWDPEPLALPDAKTTAMAWPNLLAGPATTRREELPAPVEGPKKPQEETGTGTELLSLVTSPRASVSLGNVQGCISSPQGPAQRGCSGCWSGCAAPCWICRISSTSWIGEQVTGTAATRTPGRPKVCVGAIIQGIVGNATPMATPRSREFPRTSLLGM